MQIVKWGIIGCGNVTELKSGPAFNKVSNSSLVAVMRRDAAKAEDYAARHNVPRWYSDASRLINDPEVNAIYIATPPSSHEEYALAAIAAGKPIYVEKPMSVNARAAVKMMEAAQEKNIKMSVAHYRREQPLFKKIKSLVDEKIIGDVRAVNLVCYKKMLGKNSLEDPKVAWRVNPLLSGGGLFHDLAPHQLDLMLFFFGAIDKAAGMASNQSQSYDADDTVTGTLLFQSGAVFNGTWCFSVSENQEKDWCEIIGTKGSIGFPVFDHQKLTLTTDEKTEEISFEKLMHVQQPMIQQVVNFFLGESYNPCTPRVAVAVMRLIDIFTGTS